MREGGRLRKAAKVSRDLQVLFQVAPFDLLTATRAHGHRVDHVAHVDLALGQAIPLRLKLRDMKRGT